MAACHSLGSMYSLVVDVTPDVAAKGKILVMVARRDVGEEEKEEEGEGDTQGVALQTLNVLWSH